MKVKELIKTTEWLPGKNYDGGLKPDISIILPTFRRARDGFFRRAVDSCLSQTLKNIELIIVDDASTDGTASIIDEYMLLDGRVSCLRHSRNIGLPAISEYEGYLRARADYIAFGFDDDIFYPDALEKLLEHSLLNPHRVCYGYMMMRSTEPGTKTQHTILLGQSLQKQNLRGANAIANNAVLMPRSVIEDVGMYDPHITMTRQCDWDLWRRINESHIFQFVDVAVGEVEGPSTTDSLGKTYVLDAWASEERMAQNRTELLRPACFEEVDVFSTAHSCSSINTAAIKDLSKAHCAVRKWSPPLPINEEERLGKQILVLTRDFTASTSLCFSYLPSDSGYQVRVIMPGNWSIGELARASCLIVIRETNAHSVWISAAKLLGIPTYLFLDDNLTELQVKEGATFEEDYSMPSFRERLEDFAGVLLSSNKLVEYYSDHLLHENLVYFPPAYTGERVSNSCAEKEDYDISVAFSGGIHRQAALRDSLLPALHHLTSKGRSVHLIVGGVSNRTVEAAATEKDPRLKVTYVPFEIDWKRALLQLAAHHPDILVHPDSGTINNAYKTLNCALSAHLLDAVLVVPNSVPYTDPEFSGAALAVESSRGPKAYVEALETLIANRSSWQGYRQRNRDFCDKAFNGDVNLKVLKNIVDSSVGVDATIIENRLKLLLWQAAGSGDRFLHERYYTKGMETSLLELSRLRDSIRKYRRLTFWRPAENIWPVLSSNFRTFAENHDFQKYIKSGAVLEMSSSVSREEYIEYAVPIQAGTIKSVECAFASEGVHLGELGIEIVSPSGEIIFHNTMDLATLNFGYPVSFQFKDFCIERSGSYQIRFFTRSDWPIYVFQFARYRFGRLNRTLVAPFIAITYGRAIRNDS